MRRSEEKRTQDLLAEVCRVKIVISVCHNIFKMSQFHTRHTRVHDVLLESLSRIISDGGVALCHPAHVIFPPIPPLPHYPPYPPPPPPQLRTTANRSGAVHSSNPFQHIAFGLFPLERPVTELEQPPAEGDDSPRWLRL